GALVGLAAGGVGGDCGCAGWIPLVAAVYGGIGTGVGVGISAAIQTNHVIFKRPGVSSARISVAPLVTQSRKGMMATIGFSFTRATRAHAAIAHGSDPAAR